MISKDECLKSIADKMNKERVLAYIDKMYPLTVIADRYQGIYSGGEYLAFPLQYTNILEGPIASDGECAAFWDQEDSLDYLIGKGDTPNNAVRNLQNRYVEQFLHLGGSPDVICELLGHNLIYNFPRMPTRATCACCGKKFKADYSGDILHDDIWKEVLEI